jgi:hypothetical protein
MTFLRARRAMTPATEFDRSMRIERGQEYTGRLHDIPREELPAGWLRAGLVSGGFERLI